MEQTRAEMRRILRENGHEPPPPPPPGEPMERCLKELERNRQELARYQRSGKATPAAIEIRQNTLNRWAEAIQTDAARYEAEIAELTAALEILKHELAQRATLNVTAPRQITTPACDCQYRGMNLSELRWHQKSNPEGLRALIITNTQANWPELF